MAADVRVFVSYSHDSPEHQDRVLAFAERLRADGIDVHLDQYETSPPQGWPRWMLDQVELANFVLVVCTETYHQRFRGKTPPGSGRGVKWEGAVLTQTLYGAGSRNERFIPVIFAGADAGTFPSSCVGPRTRFPRCQTLRESEHPHRNPPRTRAGGSESPKGATER